MAETNPPEQSDPTNEPAEKAVDTHTTESETHATQNNLLAVPPPTEPQLTVGDRVCISRQPPYFKTAATMPMLRPPDTIPVGTEGQITGRSPGGYWIVHFPKGSFLIESQYLQLIFNTSD